MGNNINDGTIYDCVFQGLTVILEEGIDQVLIKTFKIIFHKLDMYIRPYLSFTNCPNQSKRFNSRLTLSPEWVIKSINKVVYYKYI